MKTILPLLLLSLTITEQPPTPSGVHPLLRSPRHAEQLESLRTVTASRPSAKKATKPGLSVSIVRSDSDQNQILLSWSGVPGPYAVLKQVGGQGPWLQVGEITGATNMAVTIDGPMDLFRVQAFPSNAPPTSDSVILGQGGMNFPTKMARRSDGLHGLLRGLYGIQNDLFVWHDLSDVRHFSLPGAPTAAGCVTDFFGTNRLAYAERAGDTNRVIEWAFDSGVTSAQVVTNFGFGHPYSTIASCTLSNRPVIMSADNDVTNKAQMAFMLLWKNAADLWQQQRIVMQSSTAADTMPTITISMVEFHGAVYSFFTRDSSGAIGLVKLSGEPLTVTYSNATWLAAFPAGADPRILISGEAPPIWASVDTANDRIVLAYQCIEGETHLCTGMVNNNNYAHMSLVGLAQPGDSPYLIGETDWYDSHTSFGIIPAWADAGGITFNTSFWSPACDWSQNGIQGSRFTQAGGCAKTWFIPGANAQVLSYSDDGWLVIFTDDWNNHLCYAK